MSLTLDHSFVSWKKHLPAIYTSSISNMETALVCVRVRVGSRYEKSSQEHGITHFLEHMAFKGTQKRSALDITRDIEESGGYLNAETGHESTTYYANVLPNSVGLGLDVLLDIVLNPIFPNKEIEKERSVIIQEILEGEDNPYDVLIDALMEIAYPNQILGKSIIGTQESVSKFTQEQFLKYKNRHYVTPHLVVSCVGNVKHDNFVNLVQKKFVSPPGLKREGGERSHFSSGFIFRKKPIVQTHVAIAYEGYSYQDKRRYLMRLFQIILGEGMASRLFQSCRERLGLCYSIQASPWHFSDTGLLVITSSSDEERVPLLIKTIQEEVTHLCDDITQRELERAKALMRFSLSSVCESKGARDQWIIQYLSCEQNPPPSWSAPSPSSIIAMMNDIAKDSLIAMMNDVFSQKPAIAIVGAKNPLKSDIV